MKGFLLATLAIAGVGYGLYVGRRPEVDRSVDADPRAIVAVRLAAGHVAVEGWNRREVRIRGSAGGHARDLELRGEGQHIEILLPADGGDIDLTITIPRGGSLDLETDASDVTVDGVEGVVRLASRSGDLTVGGRPKGIVARSRTGDIDVGAEGAPGIVYSDDGEVTLRGRAAETITQANVWDRRRRRDAGCGDDAGDCARLAEALAAQAEQWEAMGEHIGAVVMEALQGIDVSGRFDFSELEDGYRFDLAGDVRIDEEEMAELFAGLEEFFAEFGEQLGERMADLGEELQDLGEELERGPRR